MASGLGLLLGLLVACLVAVGRLSAHAAAPSETESGATAAPPGVIIDADAAPLAPDPESLYIRLLAADGAVGAAARAVSADGESRGGELTLETASPAAATPTRPDAGNADGTSRSRTDAAPGDARSTRADANTSGAGRTAGESAAAGSRDQASRDQGSKDQGSKDQGSKESDSKEKDAKKSPCSEESQECREALRRLRDDAISDIALDIRVGGRPGSDYPCECRLEGETFKPRRFATTMMTWKAAGNCHKPLYFEDWSLERYGHSHGPLADPFFSAAHFFVTLPVLPYKMGVELPWECVYPLGYYRPGSCAPWTIPAVPISCRGFAVQAATVTGIVFALP
jgi:hypothetical protein